MEELQRHIDELDSEMGWTPDLTLINPPDPKKTTLPQKLCEYGIKHTFEEISGVSEDEINADIQRYQQCKYCQGIRYRYYWESGWRYYQGSLESFKIDHMSRELKQKLKQAEIDKYEMRRAIAATCFTAVSAAVGFYICSIVKRLL